MCNDLVRRYVRIKIQYRLVLVDSTFVVHILTDGRRTAFEFGGDSLQTHCLWSPTNHNILEVVNVGQIMFCMTIDFVCKCHETFITSMIFYFKMPIPCSLNVPWIFEFQGSTVVVLPESFSAPLHFSRLPWSLPLDPCKTGLACWQYGGFRSSPLSSRTTPRPLRRICHRTCLQEELGEEVPRGVCRDFHRACRVI